jgi:hypothetical protein
LDLLTDDVLLLAVRIAAAVLSFLSGWLLGRAAPDWRGDDEPVGGGNYGPPGYYDTPIAVRGNGCFAGSWGAGLSAFCVMALIYADWPPGMLSLKFMGLVVFIWLIGWTVSRVTDKGPVGPLE